MIHTIIAGGYSNYIAVYLFNALQSTLTVCGNFSSGNNPSWVTANADLSVLYAVNENPVGAVQSFSIGPNGILSGPLDTVSSGGNGPAYCVQLSKGEVAAMNYGSGNGSFTSTAIDGKTFTGPSSFINFPPPPPPNVSHPHMALEHGEEIFVPDLGADKIWRLDRSSFQIHGFIPQPKGSGPRHIAIYNDRIFTIHETSSQLSVQSIPDAPNGTVINYASQSIIPLDPPPGALYAAAEILIPPTSLQFPKPYIYVSNRNIGKPTLEGDSIAIFEHVNKGKPNEDLVLIKQVFTGLDQIRGMEIGNQANGGDQYLIAGAFSGEGGVAIFQRTDQGRDLKFVVRNSKIPRTSFVWL